MIRHSKQNWSVGQTVKVGFLTLVVKAAIATPGDSLPDVYFLANLRGDKLYQFTPHCGLSSITLDEAQERVAELNARLNRIAEQQASKSIQRAQAACAVNALFA